MGRHALLAVGVSSYPNSPNDNLASAREDLERVAGSFEKLGYQRIPLPNAGFDLSKAEFDGGFRAWIESEARADDTLAFYFVGHGQRNPQTGVHYLHFSDLRPDDMSTGFATWELLNYVVRKHIDGSVRYPVSRALFIIDCCYAGYGAGQLGQKASGYLDQREPPRLIVIPSTRPNRPALPFLFSQAWQGAVEDALAGAAATDSSIGLDTIMNGVWIRMKDEPQRPLWLPVGGMHESIGSLRFFPNPRYDPSIPSGLDLDSRKAYRSDLVEHWVPRAKGGESISDAWYFTGREAILRTLVHWLGEPSNDGRCRLITGGPGTGKSAVLGRLVTLSDAEWRERALSTEALAAIPADTLPAVGAFSCVLFARKQSLQTLAALLADALSLDTHAKELRDAQRPEQVDAHVHRLIEDIGKRSERTVILLDALDESNEPSLVADRLLRRLTGMPHVWLLVGSRPLGAAAPGSRKVRELGNAVVEIDLDDETDESDLAAYVERRLLAEEDPTRDSPYRGKPREAAATARAVAGQAAGVFLIARIVSGSLLALPAPVDPREHRFPSRIDEAFDEYLTRIAARKSSASKQRLLEVLAPFAFAEGDGLPRDYIYDAVIAAIGAASVTPGELDLVFDNVGAFIVQSAFEGRSVYRLYHEELARYVRSRFADCDGAITRSLLESVHVDDNGQRRWSNAHPYVAHHIVRHAVRTKQLDSLLVDAPFLANTDPSALVPHLSNVTGKEASGAAHAYLLVSHRLAGVNYAERLSYLELAARQLGDVPLASAFASLPAPRPWQPVWLEWQPVDPYRTLNMPTHSRKNLLLEQVDGSPRLFATTYDFATESSMLAMWDLATGGPSPTVIARDIGYVNDMCVLRHDKDWVLIVGDIVSLRRWSLQSMTELPSWEPPETGSMSSLAAFALANGTHGVAIGDESGDVSVYEYETNKLLGAWTIEPQTTISQVACREIDGKLVLICLAGASTRIVRDALAGKSTIVRVDREPRSGFHIVDAPTGPLLIISEYEYVSSYRLADPRTDQFSYKVPDFIRAATTITVAGRNMLACANLTREQIVFFDLDKDGKRVTALVGAHGNIKQLFAFSDHGIPSLLTQDERGMCKIWRLPAERFDADAKSPEAELFSDLWDVAFLPGSDPVVAKTTKGQKLEIRRAVDGTLVRDWPSLDISSKSLDACTIGEDWVLAEWSSPDVRALRLRSTDYASVGQETVTLKSHELLQIAQCLCFRGDRHAVAVAASRRSIDSCTVFAPWWLRAGRWINRKDRITHRDALDEFMVFGRGTVGTADYLLACTPTDIHVLDPSTLIGLRKFALPAKRYGGMVCIVDPGTGSLVVRLTSDTISFHPWDGGEAVTMPWVRDDFTCIDLWRTDPTPLWITGSDSGVIEFRSGGEPEPLQAIDSGGSVEKLFGDPAHGNLIALTDRGLLCIHVALHTNL